MSEIENTAELLELTTSIVSAYVSNNNVQPADLVALIASTYSALAEAARRRPLLLLPL